MEHEDRHSSGDVSQTHAFALGDELRGERATKGKTLLDVQRDLRIQANYIAAIEDGDLSAFPNPSFIPGYIRSYARYLDLDPAEVYRRFCAEHGFSYGPASAAARPHQAQGRSGQAPGQKKGQKAGKSAATLAFQPKFPLSEPRRGIFSDVQLSAIGSLLVLLLLIAGLGYGGWTVLQNIQRVQFAPVEDLPLAQSDMNTMEAPEIADGADAAFADLASPVAATSLADLYRQQELEVPILAPRDGPIAAINPDDLAPIRLGDAGLSAGAKLEPVEMTPSVVAPLVQAVYSEEAAAAGAAEGAEAAAMGDMPLSVIAERAAWIRVYLDNGTIIFERILEKGESYTPPEGVGAPLIWAGNSGSVYVQLGDALRGPLGSGTRAVRDISLDPATVVAQFPVVSEIPEVISQSIGPSPVRQSPTGAPVAIQ